MLGNVSLFSSHPSPVNMTNYSTKFYIIVKVCVCLANVDQPVVDSVVDSSLELILVQSLTNIEQRLVQGRSRIQKKTFKDSYPCWP